MKKVSLGLDFGTLSVRVVALDIETGDIIGTYSSDYDNGVIEDFIPNTNIKLKERWSLQNPRNYLKSMDIVLEKIVNKISNNYKIISIGLDFTSSTVMPLNNKMEPLMYKNELYNNPHAWPKLWKHHAAQKYATKINELAEKRNEEFLSYYGGKISAEWLLPKALQILEEDEDLYNEIYKFIEAGDWITYILTGNEKRSKTMAGFKSVYYENKFPSKKFLKELNPKFENFIEEKLTSQYYLPTDTAGNLNDYYKDKLKLNYDIPIGVANIDAHAAIGSIPFIGGDILLSSVGTSSCDILIHQDKIIIPGIAGIVKSGIIKNYYAYEAGQSAVGDIFAWFMDNLVPDKYYQEAKKRNMTIYEYFEELIKDIPSGETGLIALDWFNGNRSILMDADLTGLILGLRIDTKPEYIYRALIEATAFGKKVIIDQFEQSGIKINKIVFTGGLPQRNQELNRIYSDILNKEIILSEYDENGAVGSAIFGLVASQEVASFQEAIKVLKPHNRIIKPKKENVEKYYQIFLEYKKLHDYFSEENNVMKILKAR